MFRIVTTLCTSEQIKNFIQYPFATKPAKLTMTFLKNTIVK